MSDVAVKKVDLRFPVDFLDQVDMVAGHLGVTRNAFFSMAVAELAVRSIPLCGAGKNRLALKKLAAHFQKALDTSTK